MFGNNRKNKKIYYAAALLSLVLLFLFFSANRASAAGLEGAVSSLVSWIILKINFVLGYLLTFIINILVNVAQYNGFISSPVVEKGWVIVRDLSNMFFILILLVIAFATILRLESYSWKKMLPKLLLMAVLINFSKTIAGLFIDFSQVIMLTFVSAFAQNGGANFVKMFQVDKYVSMSTGQCAEDNLNSMILLGAVSGMIALIITLVVTVVLLAILVMRIVMLWVYVILSPLAYLLSAFPQGQKYASQWWSEFSKNVITGPVLAFFLWLALTTTSATVFSNNFETDKISVTGGSTTAALNDPCGGTKLFTTSPFQVYIVTIALLIGGLIVTQQAGGVAAGIAGKGMASLQKGRALAMGAGAIAGFWAGRKIDTAQMKVQKKIAGVLGQADHYAPKSLNYRIAKQGWKRSRAEDMEKYETQHGGLQNIWHDNFNKYVRLGQYGAIRKGKKSQAADIKQAERLDEENKMMQRRIGWANLSEPDKLIAVEKLKANEQRIKQEYQNKGFTAEQAGKEFNKDRETIMTPTVFAKEIEAEYDKKIKANDEKIKGLREEKIFGFKGATQYEPRFWKSGAQGQKEKDKKEIMERTGGKDFAVVSELIQALKEKDDTKMAAAFEILAGNNDLNEALKDSRVIHLMAQSGGILEKVSRDQGLNDQETEQVVKDFRTNPVTPAYAQAMVQGMFKEIGLEKNLAARYADKVGSISFAGGNSLGYGMAVGNASTGSFEFSKMKFKNGALVTSDERMGAIRGKFANLESQQKMRTLHPDVFIKEDYDGNATGLSEEGKDFINTLTPHDLGQISRMRLDVIRKIGLNDHVLGDLEKMVDALEKEGAGQDKQKAQLIKTFTGYIISKSSGKGVEDEKYYKGAIKAYDKKIKGIEPENQTAEGEDNESEDDSSKDS